MSVKSTNKYVEVLDSSGNQIDSTHPLYTSPATGSTTDVSDRAARDLGKVDIAAFDSALPAGTNLMGKVGIDQTTPGTTNGVQVNAALPAGTNLMGKVGIDQTTPGTTNGVQVNAALPAGDNNIGNVDIVSLPAGNLGQKAMAASLSIVPASDITDATYVGDIKFGESLPAGSAIIGNVRIDQTTPGTTNGVVVTSITAGDTNIGNVDIVSLPSGNLGQQAMAASLSMTPANNITDLTYIGNVKLADGGDIAQGTTTDAAVTDPTASASVIAALKGLLKQLQGTAAIVTKVDVEPSTLASTYFIKRTNITTASVNLAFGFTSKTIMIETGQSNDAEIAISYLGGTAVAPAANTAGNDLVDAGRIITLDVATTSISVIAVSGTQTIYVRAWR